MDRLIAVKNYLIAQGEFKDEDMACHVLESEIVPVELETETGFCLFDEKYEGLIYVLNVTRERYRHLKLLLYEWFRENGDKVNDERFRLSADAITDKLSFVTVTLNLVETEHIAENPEGIIERNDARYEREEAPTVNGI